MPNVNVKRLLQELVVPELQEIKADIREIKVEIRRLDEKIDSGLARLDVEMHSDFKRLDEKIEINLEFRDRFAALEAKVAALTAASSR
ncbi:MAG: hypothetical protein AB1349_02480 [Elusimicrobiota bacterium]